MPVNPLRPTGTVYPIMKREIAEKSDKERKKKEHREEKKEKERKIDIKA